MSDSEFNRILQERARRADPREFRQLLEKYGHLDDCVDIMRKGVAAHGNRESSGDWTSSASSGWQSYKTKRDLLEQHILDRGPRGSFNTNAGDDRRVAELEQQVAALQRRVENLETRGAGNRFKLK